jgi:putative transposase
MNRWESERPTHPVPEGRLNTEQVMAHSYSNTLIHCVFSTKERRKIITPSLEARLHPYLGGVAKTHDMTALAVGGVEDHVHLLLSLPGTLPVAKAIQLIKGGSSKWVHDTFPDMQYFAWQEGYGAFSIGISQVERTRTYIHRQAEHHRSMSFEDEFVQFLRRHGIALDPRYVWG